jgi:hypothetical protein
MDKYSDEILSFYKKRNDLYLPKRLELEPSLFKDGWTVANSNSGLGDTLSVMSIPPLCVEQNRAVEIFSNSSHYPTLCKYVSQRDNYARKLVESRVDRIGYLRVEMLTDKYDCGNGHFFQQIQRGLGFIPDILPTARLTYDKPKIKNKVVLNFNAGAHVSTQRQTIHPRARELYPEHKASIQQFINENKAKYYFVEVGTDFSGLENVEDKTKLHLNESIDEVATSEFYLGIHSGVTNLAAAFSVKSIVIINFPEPSYVRLPMVVPVGVPDMTWLYPQNVHLHEDGDDLLCPIVSVENLTKAFNGEIYPFFNDNYLDLIKCET